MKFKNLYDTIIVGAGPAGLFAAEKLSSEGESVLLVDRGCDIEKRRCPVTESKKQCISCKPCHIMYGFGGAGGLSDGKCILSSRSGVNLTKDLHPVVFDEEEINKIIDGIDRILVKCGAPKELNFDEEKSKFLKTSAAKSGIDYIPAPKKHIGSDRLRIVMHHLKEHLLAKNVDIVLNTNVSDIHISNGICEGVYIKGKKVRAKRVILAPGRSGAFWFMEMVHKYNLEYQFQPLDIGVRVEVPNEIIENITNIDYDPKFWIFTDKYEDFVRTYCTNPRGFVVKERYLETLGKEIFVGVNGHANSKIKSNNANFALLVSHKLTDPQKDMFKYTMSLAYIFYNLGAGKPILQTYGDLKNHRRSKESSLHKINLIPSLTDVTLGDLAMGFSFRLMQDIIDTLERLNGVMRGINSNNTLIYGPEIKFKHIRGKIKKNFETTRVKNLFLAGDGCGLSGGIINAATTGVLAAQGILRD